MMWYTHAAFGLFLGLLFSPLFLEYRFFFMILVVLGSLLPDIDHEGSKINKILPVTRWFAFLFTHRGFFHSLFPAALLYVVFFVFGLHWVGIALALGYLSHLFLDGLTKMGVNLLHPYLHVRGFIEVGGMVELLVFWSVIGLTGYLLI